MNSDPQRLQSSRAIVRSGVFLCVLQICLWIPTSASAQTLACKPCTGIRVADPGAVIDELLAAPQLDKEAILFVAWNAPLDGTARLDEAVPVAESGAIPWLRLQFTTPAPLSANLELLEAELEQASQIAEAAGPQAHFPALRSNRILAHCSSQCILSPG